MGLEVEFAGVNVECNSQFWGAQGGTIFNRGMYQSGMVVGGGTSGIIQQQQRSSSHAGK